MAKLPFLDRDEELTRLESMVARPEGAFGVVYGRRRCGKSRLIRELISGKRSVLYVGDDTEGSLQRAGLATEIARLLPGFDEATYPQWSSLFQRFWSDAPKGTVLVLDEFPSMVAVSPELPSVLQKRIDEPADRIVHLVLAGSSQRMMRGLVLDSSAPLYGRATEILKLSPLSLFWIQRALRFPKAKAAAAVEAYAVWGGIPRYWELASDHPDRRDAIRELVLSPLGVLHEEPRRLLTDDLRETTQASSILSLIGGGSHRMSEIAGRLEKPATSLSRPLQRLVELELVTRDIPFRSSPRTAKRSLYRIGDPFLRFWFRFVEPNLSRLEGRAIAAVANDIERDLPHHVGGIWEDLVRASVPRTPYANIEWGPAGRWWGSGLDGKPMEVDVVAESVAGGSILVGEVKWSSDTDMESLFSTLERTAAELPLARGKEVVLAAWVKSTRVRATRRNVFSPSVVVEALR